MITIISRNKYFLIIALTLLCAACAPPTNYGAGPVLSANYVKTLSYDKSQRHEIQQHNLEHSGSSQFPLFVFLSQAHHYSVDTYVINNAFQYYFFIYKDNKLFSILTPGTILNLWDQNFGKSTYEHPTYPIVTKFPKIVEAFYKQRLPIQQTNFRKINQAAKQDIEKGYHQSLAAGAVFIPIEIGMFAGTAAELAPLYIYGAGQSLYNARKERIENAKVEKALRNTKLGMPRKALLALYKPTKHVLKHPTPSILLYIFLVNNRLTAVTFGFGKADTLQWIGYNFLQKCGKGYCTGVHKQKYYYPSI